jgi:hypothetical protein
MNKMKMVHHTTAASTQVYINVAKPSAPVIIAKAEANNTDPAAASNSRYPIPSFFEYRIKPKTYDPL